ncbi:hypothetical protein PG993_000720 [Apiospora rasikravindrae]|uniref:Uncharacterized protein n=1 Tax=Apiospora rasikravindrae TaxID=990691 RepID=A0ABR1U9C2_9PEZI
MAETPDTAKASASSAVLTSNSTLAHQPPDSSEQPPFSSLPTTTSTAAISPTTSSDAPNNRSNYHDHRQSHSSSKLPAFRFTDLKKESLAHPSLLHGIPSPVTPGDTETETQIQSSSNAFDSGRDNSSATTPVSPEQLPASPDADPEDSRSLTFQAPGTNSTVQGATITIDARHIDSPDPVSSTKPEPEPESEPAHADQLTTTKASQPSNTDGTKSSLTTANSTETVVASQPPKRRAPTSSSTSVLDFASGSRQALGAHQRFNSAEGSRSAAGDAAQGCAQVQRELKLPKSVKRKSASDDKRTSASRRPPVSYKPPGSAGLPSTGSSTSIPPIRSFRSSGSRRSFGIDMNFTSPRYEDAKGGDSNHRDRTLRALEGRQDDDTVRWAPQDSAADRAEADDDSGDVFLKMARDPEPESNAVSRVIRSHRRPLSAAVPSYIPLSPPQFSRRMSDQETSRNRAYGLDQMVERASPKRILTYRQDQSSDGTRSKVNGAPSRPPLTPRTIPTQDILSEASTAYGRRRQSITESAAGAPARTSSTSLKQPGLSSYGTGRTYNSSPLVPQKQENQPGDIQTESSTSTAAPSTVWDELDELKSPDWKDPPTSGAAMSRASDDRPPTATTNATTMSASPKRGSTNGVQHNDASSTVSTSQREGHPLLQSALGKSKTFLAFDVYSALETAASDALALSTMIGAAGQPGPISSGTSNTGASANVTNRQLRRKADSICRSLTELCLALSEGQAQSKQQLQLQQPTTTPPAEPEPPSSPTIRFTGLASPSIPKFTGVAPQRRPSAAMIDRSPHSLVTSPRAMSRLEEKRSSMLQASNVSSPSRYSSNMPPTPADASGRRTSLLIPRTRRAVTEEPEEQTGRKSTLLRTRRAGTEEPEETPMRSTSLLRTRRNVEYEEESPRMRAPSRAITEVAVTRSGREYRSSVPLPSIETNHSSNVPLPSTEMSPSSALPRKRLTPSTLSSRLSQPSASTSGLSTRRYYNERVTPERERERGERETNSLSDKLAEERGQRHFSLGSISRIARAGSIHTNGRNRESMAASSPTTAQNGRYR